MTNFEKLASNKEALAELLDNEIPFTTRVQVWWCEEGHCPHSVNGECPHEECVDIWDHSDKDVIKLWLDSEVDDESSI